ncbi:hypothetical protein FHT00_002108 [Sphingomonas insulae]|uniref:Uncharacterized protein n=1 Tax=Sphingomonas insulae TaxID=424800 RepID=A0ABN1HLY2_9SPHN|nr:hypothetical protein [Sphingomonas insulae]NIJ30145.1 hypothetical protein [Sphingomonas insulae]
MPSSPAHPTAALPNLEPLARRFAAMTQDDAEAAIDIQVANAIREWRISDATFWQRIKFRSRMIRTVTAQHPSPSKA